jgi:hypothetical protein
LLIKSCLLATYVEVAPCVFVPAEN